MTLTIVLASYHKLPNLPPFAAELGGYNMDLGFTERDPARRARL